MKEAAELLRLAKELVSKEGMISGDTVLSISWDVKRTYSEKTENTYVLFFRYRETRQGHKFTMVQRFGGKSVSNMQNRPTDFPGAGDSVTFRDDKDFQALESLYIKKDARKLGHQLFNEVTGGKLTMVSKWLSSGLYIPTSTAQFKIIR